MPEISTVQSHFNSAKDRKSKIKDQAFYEFERYLDRSINELLEELGKHVMVMVENRTSAGFGVDLNGTKKQFPPLTPQYREWKVRQGKSNIRDMDKNGTTWGTFGYDVDQSQSQVTIGFTDLENVHWFHNTIESIYRENIQVNLLTAAEYAELDQIVKTFFA